MICNNLVQDTDRYATTSWSNIDQSDNKRNPQVPHMQQNNASLHNITWDSKMKTSNNYNEEKNTLQGYASIKLTVMKYWHLQIWRVVPVPRSMHGLLPVIKQEMENKGQDLGL